MRLFVAVALPPDDRARLATIVDRLSTTGADVKWVEPQNLHITLHFLGDVDAEQRDPVTIALRDAAAACAAPVVQLGGLGCFPPRGAPRVVWCGLMQGGPELRALVEGIRGAVVALGFPSEGRPWKAHVTLGRVRGRHNTARLLETLQHKDADGFDRFVPHGITLFRSHLGSGGPRYEVLAELPFGAT